MPQPSRRPLVVGLTLALVASLAPMSALSAPGGAVAVATDRDSLTSRQGEREQGYPRRTRLVEPATDPGDAALRPGLAAYDQIAPRLNALQERSDRVSVEVIGRSVEGRDLYLVTLTAPESVGQTRQQDRMRERILTRPAQAASDTSLARGYKVPVFVNANIHGDEWEGTDAALRLIEDYATSTDPAVRETLRRTRISLVVTMNPDGRHGNTRANAAGFDLNRDFITATQPETVAVRDTIVALQPMMLLDLHGYVNGTLIEPTTPPHAENLEFDLMLRHALPSGLAIEEAVLDLGYGTPDGVAPPQIPFRDWDEGWDGWPPIFTPQYAALQGASAQTIELPLRANRASYDLPIEELRRRSSVNTDIALAAVTATLGYAVDEREDLIATQIEWYRRGETGAPQVPVTATGLPGAGEEDVYLTDYPRAYVVPVGTDQRSEVAAARLVDHLVDNGVEVTTARRDLRVGGRTYPAGSYVIDMHQARRGMAGVILGPGTDISPRVDAMYDISGWSHALLWGADVASVPEGTRLPPTGRPVTGADRTGGVSGSGPWQLELSDPADGAALNDLLAAGVEVTWTEQGTAVLPRQARRAVAEAAREHGVTFTQARTTQGEDLDPVSLAVSAPATEVFALQEMGFEVVPVTTTGLNEGFDWSDVDTLYVSSGLRWGDLEAQAREELTAFLGEGGALVGRGAAGAALNDSLGLLDVTTVAGRGDANGVVRVDSSDGAIAGGATAETFVYSPLWFTDLGPEVTVDQAFAAQDLVVAGHWRADDRGRGGPGQAAGQAVLVHGLDTDGATAGAPVALFGSEPLFRAHPKGQYALVARALLWSTVAR